MTENRRILIVDDNPAIHDDIKSVLIPESNQTSDKLSQLENDLFGPSRSQNSSLNGEIEKYEIDSAFQGDEAIKMIDKAFEEEREYALIFMDVRMPPGIDGIETIQRVREKHPNNEIIICTAYSDYSWDQIIEKIGKTHNLLFLKKPFESAAVQQMALSLTRKWNLRQETQNLIANLESTVNERTKDLQRTLEKLKKEMKEKAEAEEELEVQRSKSLYAAKMASLGEIAGGIAHEINNPLTVILTSAELLQEIIDENSNDLTGQLKILQKYNGKILSMSERIGKIVRGLKNISRQSDSDPFISEKVCDIVDETVDLCQQKFREFNVQLELPKIPLDLTISCRKTEISQVFLNLLTNSFDAILEYEEKWIKCDVTDLQDMVQISVTDSGPGISKEVEKKMLQPFFTTKEVGKGTGLGLPISKGLIEAHNGRLEVDHSCSNTRFVITLPKNQPENLEDSGPGHSQSSNKGA